MIYQAIICTKSLTIDSAFNHLATLAYFLTSVTQTDNIDSYYKIALSDENTSQGQGPGDLSFEKNKTTIRIKTDLDCKWDKEVFTSSAEAFIAILEKWEQLLQENHREIVITQDGDKITLEGRD
ncbi:hypothetical protein JW872_00565 [Candidatus Babeliales bacterium]|nr:hypothetical protein [Candidatus Babeliales bacterium]